MTRGPAPCSSIRDSQRALQQGLAPGRRRAVQHNVEQGTFVKGYTIGELARATGVHIETIRYYQRIGLLPVPPRTKGTARRYGPEAVERLLVIRGARRLLFSIPQVAGLIAASDDPQGCAEARAIAGARLAEVEREVATLQGIGRELAALMRLCEAAEGSPSAILRHLSRPGPADT
jgi:DNA-binding transcriptional MerR regulator